LGTVGGYAYSCCKEYFGAFIHPDYTGISGYIPADGGPLYGRVEFQVVFKE